MIYWFDYEEPHHHPLGRALPRLPGHRSERRHPRIRWTHNRRQRLALRTLRRCPPFPRPPHRHPDLNPVIIWYTFTYQPHLHPSFRPSLLQPWLFPNGNHNLICWKLHRGSSSLKQSDGLFSGLYSKFLMLFSGRYEEWIYWINTIKIINDLNYRHWSSAPRLNWNIGLPTNIKNHSSSTSVKSNQSEVSGYSSSGWMGVNYPLPNAFNLSDNCPLLASWAISARLSNPQSLSILSLSSSLPVKRAQLKARTGLLFFVANFMTFSMFFLLFWSE